jgi:hypothetical protein
MGSFFTKIILPVLILFGGLSQKKCREYYEKAKGTTFDIIIVPGMPYENNKWDTIMKGRVYWAKHLYETNITKRIMFSGGAVYTPFYESTIMALYARELGIPDSVIFIEDKAEHSTENIYYGYKKVKKLGFNEIALASDPHQCKKLRKFIASNFKEVVIIPFVKNILGKGFKPNPTIHDSIAFKPDFISIRQRESFHKRRQGTKGKNINKSLYEEP